MVTELKIKVNDILRGRPRIPLLVQKDFSLQPSMIVVDRKWKDGKDTVIKLETGDKIEISGASGDMHILISSPKSKKKHFMSVSDRTKELIKGKIISNEILLDEKKISLSYVFNDIYLEKAGFSGDGYVSYHSCNTGDYDRQLKYSDLKMPVLTIIEKHNLPYLETSSSEKISLSELIDSEIDFFESALLAKIGNECLLDNGYSWKADYVENIINTIKKIRKNYDAEITVKENIFGIQLKSNISFLVSNESFISDITYLKKEYINTIADLTRSIDAVLMNHDISPGDLRFVRFLSRLSNQDSMYCTPSFEDYSSKRKHYSFYSDSSDEVKNKVERFIRDKGKRTRSKLYDNIIYKLV